MPCRSWMTQWLVVAFTKDLEVIRAREGKRKLLPRIEKILNVIEKNIKCYISFLVET